MRSVAVTNKAVAFTKPYNRPVKDSNHHILVMGDSSMYSAGVTNPKNTVGGLLAGKYPKSSVETVAFIGAKAKDLEHQFVQAQHKRYDLVVIGVGGNDIVQFTSISKVQLTLSTFLETITKTSDEVVLCHVVNVGNIGFFLFPLNHLYSWRSRIMNELYWSIGAKFPGLKHAVFFRPPHQDHFDRHTRHKFVAPDGFHATDYANQYFFKLICDAVQKPGI